MNPCFPQLVHANMLVTVCIICYNDFGVENPEGINEAPLRLPKCKHVFGDHCIKKWLGESDSCPYCRDKVPSEPQYKGSQTIREYLSRAAAIPIHRSNFRQHPPDHRYVHIFYRGWTFC